MTDPSTHADATATEPPLLTARGLGLRTRRGWVFRDVDLEVLPGSVVALAGEAGTGRTSALMALASIMEPTHGRLESGASVSVARLEGIAELEARFTIDECVAERLLLSRIPTKQGRQIFTRACADLDLPASDKTWIEDLEPAHRTSLAVALALMSEPDIIVLDDLDAGVDLVTQRSLWRQMRVVSETPVAVLATTLDSEPAVGAVDSIIRLLRPVEEGNDAP